MMNGGAAGRLCQVGGVAARVAGAGPPVLFLHGIGGSAESFSGQLGGLGGFSVIAWDAPGYGASADPAAVTEAEPADRYARWAVRLLRGLGQESAHVVGVSWGGVIATRVALRHPDAVRSLTLADSSRGSGRTEQGRAGMLRRVEDLACLGPRAFARLRAPGLLAPGAPPEVADRVIATMAQVRLPGYQGAAEMMAATDHSADLARITVPALVLVGEHDRVTGVPESRALADGIPGARFAVIPGGGHAVNQENPGAFNRELAAFLDEVELARVRRNVGPGRRP
jgi:pimeloyl-ACP methyl ester carboxylesterase